MNGLFLVLFIISLICLIIGLTKPKTFSKLTKGETSKKKITMFFLPATVIFFILFGLTTNEAVNDDHSPQTTTSLGANENDHSDSITDSIATDGENQREEVAPVEYTTAQISDLGHKAYGPISQYTAEEIENFPVCEKMSYYVVVSPEIKEEQVVPTIYKIIDDYTSEDEDIDEVIVLIYSDEQMITDGLGYDIASAIWAQGGELGNVTQAIARSNDRSGYEISIIIKENLEEYLTQRNTPELKFGLTEEERRQLFKELVAAEDRAMEEADNLYPIDPSYPDWEENISRNVEKADELDDMYKAEIRARWGISEEEQLQIVVEGIEEHWSMH